MAKPHVRRHKEILFDVDGNRFECQINNWNLDPGEQDGDRIYTLCPEGETTSETDSQATLAVTWFADWRLNGMSDYMWANRGKEAHVTITHHPHLPGETVVFDGDIRLKAPPVGGEARSNETNEVTYQVTNLNYVHQ